MTVSRLLIHVAVEGELQIEPIPEPTRSKPGSRNSPGSARAIGAIENQDQPRVEDEMDP